MPGVKTSGFEFLRVAASEWFFTLQSLIFTMSSVGIFLNQVKNGTIMACKEHDN
jgi:hypothetical protein